MEENVPFFSRFLWCMCMPSQGYQQFPGVTRVENSDPAITQIRSRSTVNTKREEVAKETTPLRLSAAPNPVHAQMATIKKVREKQKAVAEPDENESVTEDIMLKAKFFVRSSGKYSLESELPALGIRKSKKYFTVKPVRCGGTWLMAMVKLHPNWAGLMQPGEAGAVRRNALREFLMKINHPYIMPAQEVEYAMDSSHAVVFREYSNRGSLRDIITSTKGSEAKGKGGLALAERRCAMYGRMILEAMVHLRSAGVFFTGVHSGNILIDNNGGRCLLTDYENVLLGLSSSNMPYLEPLLGRVDPDVLCFGHVFYEMTVGIEVDGVYPMYYPDNYSREMRRILDSIFDLPPSDVKKKREKGASIKIAKYKVSLEDLLAHPFFNRIELPHPFDRRYSPTNPKAYKVLKDIIKISLDAQPALYAEAFRVAKKRSKRAMGGADESVGVKDGN